MEAYAEQVGADRPTKRQRILMKDKAAEAASIAAQDTSEPAFAPLNSTTADGAQPPPPPPPTNDDIVPPPPESDAPPPPPSPPPNAPADYEDSDAKLMPPSPPPEQEDDDDEVGGTEYWANLAEQDKKKRQENTRDLYLDTVNRSLLDFDFEKVCSVSLSNINVYACLVCGKYFQGRGKSSYAYYHSINDGHRVYMNLNSAQVYILPDNYQVNSPSLSDIQFLLNPTFTPQQIAQLDAPDASPSLDLQAQPYIPGFVGLNNIAKNDYMNVVIQALAHVKPLRDFFIRGGPKMPGTRHLKGKSGAVSAADASGSLIHSTELARRFGALVRKLWNPKAFKGQVSPHEFLQEVNNTSEGRFKLTQQGDPVEFLGWLLNRLHADLTGGKRKHSSIISCCFQGQVRIESQKVIVRSGLEDSTDFLDYDGRREGGQEDEHGNAKFNIDKEVQTMISPFFLLAVDLPPPPIFQDSVEKDIIPQVTIASVLAKYDGVTFQEAKGMIRRFRVKKLPPFAILHFRRFTKNQFVEERNPSVVNFPIKGLDLGEYADPGSAPISSMYDLVCNITHEAMAGTVRENSVWRAQAHTRLDGIPAQNQKVKQEEKWFQLQDLIVEELNKQMIFLGESYIQIWERKGAVQEVEDIMTRCAVAAKRQGERIAI